MQIAHKFVTELELADRVLSTDYILISQRETNDTEYMSRKFPYSKLCAAVAGDFVEVVSSGISSAASALAVSVWNNFCRISALSDYAGQTVSAVVKIANCVQKNKADISALSVIAGEVERISCLEISGENGLSSRRAGAEYKWVIGHSRSVRAEPECKPRNVAYDRYGHVVSSTDMTSSDVVGLGSFITGVGQGLSSDGHTATVVPATPDGIGGVRPGANLVVFDDGTLSAKDTTYSAGSGLSLDGQNRFNLVKATASQIGGVKVGANLSVNDGTLCAAYIGTATETSAGVIELGYTPSEDEPKCYPVKLAGKKAYVSVPWTDSTYSLLSGTYTTSSDASNSQYATISAISYNGGNVTGISTSMALYDLVSGIQLQANAVSSLSDCITVKNGQLAYDIDDGTLTLAGGVQVSDLVKGGVRIPAVVSGEVVSAEWHKDGEGDSVSSAGAYVKLGLNTAEDESDNVYVDVSNLSSVTFRSETWVFTLDDGSVVSNVVMLGR